jgi:hypothetical protein
MIFVECSAIQRMNSTTSMVPIPLKTAPSATVANSSLAIGTGPVSLTRAPYSPARLRSKAACGFSRLQRVKIEDRLELDEGPPIGGGQSLVADEFAPGERRVAIVQHVLDRLGDQVERPLGAIEFDLPTLDPG